MTEMENVSSTEMVQAILSELEIKGKPDAQGNYTAFCPFHNDRKRPNLKIHADKGYKCFACPAKGSIRKLAKHLGIMPNSFKEESMEKRIETKAEALALLRQRGLTEETILHFQIEPDLGKQAWRYPVLYEGKVVATRYKAFPNRQRSKYWWQPEGDRFPIYGLDDVQGETEVWLVAGEADLWICYQAGLKAITFLFGEGTVPKEAARLIWKAGIKKLNIVYDLDDAGTKGAQKVAQFLKGEGFDVLIRTLPDYLGEGGDTTDLYRWLGSDDAKFCETMQSLQTVQLPQTTQSIGLHVLSLSELLSQPSNEIPSLVSGILPAGGVLVIAGEPGTGKTWLVLTLARDIATGQAFLDRFATKEGAVLIIDEESGVSRLRFRLKRLLDDEPAKLPIYIASMSGIDLGSRHWVDALQQKIEELRPAIVIIDSLVRVHRGDENSAQAMAQVFAALSEIRQQFGCAFVLTHHLRKRGQLPSLNTLDQRMRGSSDITAYADSVLGLEQIDNRLILRQFKNRDGELVKPLALALEDTNEENTQLVVVAEVDEEADKRKQAREVVREMLMEGTCFREDLVASAKEAGISERTLADALGDLVRSGEVKRGKKGRKATYATVQ